VKYEHLVQINDPDDPAIVALTRRQLWNGLKARAENPDGFVYGLDAMRILARGADYLERELHFGNRIINDRVSFAEEDSVQYRIEPSAEFPSSSLLMCIEEPKPGHLFVRFSYETASLTGSEYDEFVRQAYFEADLDTIARIRRLAASGILD
jgi:hypothetical protein